MRKELTDRGICVIIPTFNNAGTIVDVVARSKEQCDDVIVVCDGCTDGTPALLRSMDNPPDIVEYSPNRGKGAALVKGLRHARAKGFAYAITLDGDGQHFPEDIPLFLEANRRHPDALIVGGRQNLDSVERSAGSRFANAFANFWFFVQTLCPLKDTQSGYRLYPLRRLPCLRLVTSRYESELELLVLSSWRGVRIESVPVRVHYPSKELRVSHFRPAKDFSRIFCLNTLLCLLVPLYAFPRLLCRKALTFGRTAALLSVFFVATVLYLTPLAFFRFTFRPDAKNNDSGCNRLWLGGKLCSMVRTGMSLMRHIGAEWVIDRTKFEELHTPCVVICNHQSLLDLLPMVGLCPKMVIMTAPRVLDSRYYGYMTRKAGYFSSAEGLEAILPRLQELVAQGYSIGVFPEGTRSKDDSIGRFHQGAFCIASRLGLDIAPALIYGSGRVMNRKSPVIRPWKLFYTVGDKISRQELDAMDFRTQASTLRKRYILWYRQVADKMEKEG